MALSIISIPGDGVTDTFTVSFALGILDRTSTTAWVTGEVDGGGNKIYRTITYLSDTLLKISGAKAGVGVMVVFTRTVSQTNLIVNYEDGDIMNETNLNTSQKQALMLVHQVLDGRFSAFIQNVSAGGFKITNLGTPTVATDASTKGYVDSVIATGAANAAAAAASAAAALASQNAAAASQGAAATSAANALTYSNNSSTFATNSSNSATASATSASASQTSRLASEAARDKAQEWSDKPEDVFVSGTTEYSAYHWSRKALGYVTGSISTVIHGSTAKTPVDADEGLVLESVGGGFGLKKFTFSSLITYIFGAARTFASNVIVAGTLSVTGTLAKGITYGFTTIAGSTGAATTGLVLTSSGTTPSVISFERSGAFAAHFGIDSDNKWKVGGWSMGLNSYEIVHLGNITTLAVVRGNTDQTFTAGYAGAFVNDGTASGNYMPTNAGGNMRLVGNNGAFTFLADTDVTAKSYTLVVLVQNAAAAGAITMSGWNGGITGDAFTTLNGALFMCSIVKHGGTKTIHVQAL